MKRSLVLLVVILLLAACSGTGADPSPQTPPAAGPTSPTFAAPPATIVFKRLEPTRGETAIYTSNLEGGDLKQVHPGPAEGARWSPDGTEIAFLCCDDGMAAHLLDPETGEVRGLPPPDPKLETYCGGPWSPDGERLTCESFGVDDPSRNGIYSILASDGSDLTRITTNPGGDDLPGDYSPDGTRLVFIRADVDGPVGLFVTNVDGSGLRRLSPPGMLLDDSGYAGRWSPDGHTILFVAHPGPGRHKAIWTVDPDGGEPEQLPVTPACGGPASDPGELGCYAPDWSPDGEQIVFTRSNGAGESIFVMNADGTGVVRVTTGEDDQPDWA